MLEEEMAGDGQRDIISGGSMVQVWNKTRLQWDSALGKMAPAAGRRHPRGDIKTTGCVYDAGWDYLFGTPFGRGLMSWSSDSGVLNVREYVSALPAMD